MYLIIDNYDSFTYILQDYFLQLTNNCVVYKNDAITIDAIRELQPSRIILSPGPGTPAQSGICREVIAAFHKTIPILGVCLGHQAIGEFFGARLVHAIYPMHGKVSKVAHNQHPLFKGVAPLFDVMRYHSLVLTDVPEEVIPLAVAKDDSSIMAIAHKEYPCIGIQFHPESIGTPQGMTILRNWVSMSFDVL